MTDLEKQIIELQEALAELKSYLPKVPTMPYEKELAKTLKKLKAKHDILEAALELYADAKWHYCECDGRVLSGVKIRGYEDAQDVAREAFEKIEALDKKPS